MKLGETTMITVDGKDILTTVWSEGPEKNEWWLSDGKEFYLMQAGKRGKVSLATHWREEMRGYLAYLDSHISVWQVYNINTGRITYHLDGDCKKVLPVKDMRQYAACVRMPRISFESGEHCRLCVK